MSRALLSFFLFAAGVAITAPSSTQNTGGAFPPTVNEGHRSIQYRVTIDPGNSAGETGVTQRLYYQQALNDNFMWRVLGQARRTANSDFNFDFLQAELFLADRRSRAVSRWRSI